MTRIICQTSQALKKHLKGGISKKDPFGWRAMFYLALYHPQARMNLETQHFSSSKAKPLQLFEWAGHSCSCWEWFPSQCFLLNRNHPLASDLSSVYTWDVNSKVGRILRSLHRTHCQISRANFIMQFYLYLQTLPKCVTEGSALRFKQIQAFFNSPYAFSLCLCINI